VIANAKSRRRWFGALCLLTALVMLVAGETLLSGKLGGVTLIGYWLGCFVLTAIAAGVALIDASRMRREQRDEHRALIESTLQAIEQQKRSRKDAKG